MGFDNGELGELCPGFLGPHSPILGRENVAALLGQRGHFFKRDFSLKTRSHYIALSGLEC